MVRTGTSNDALWKGWWTCPFHEHRSRPTELVKTIPQERVQDCTLEQNRAPVPVPEATDDMLKAGRVPGAHPGRTCCRNCEGHPTEQGAELHTGAKESCRGAWKCLLKLPRRRMTTRSPPKSLASAGSMGSTRIPRTDQKLLNG